MTRRTRPRYGFTLLELIMCLSLTAMVLTLANQLVHNSFKNIMNLTKLHSGNAHLDHCVAALRRDTWESQSAASSKPSELTLKLEGDSTITWTAIDSTITRTRTAPSGEGDTQHWTIALPLQFEASPGAVTLIVHDKSTEQRIAMVRPAAFTEARP
jgi:prepilin-type N-terminal cleavage/methylation domain-containing protein